MKLLETIHISNFPDDVFLGYSEIREDLSSRILIEPEKQEWEVFTNQHRRNEFLTGRHLFKEMLRCLGIDADFTIQKHALGKPFATCGVDKLYVSFSHSKNHVFCTFSPSVDIGLDTEWLDRKVDERIVKRILGENEWEVFSEENPILLWTIKEAAVKCLGTGLRTNLKELTIQKNDRNEFLVIINNEKSFQICSFQELNHQISIAY